MAILECDKALEIDPYDASIYDNKGYYLFELGKVDEAISLTSKAIECDERYANAWYNRACYYASKNKVDECISDLQRAFELDKQYIDNVLQDKDFGMLKDDD